MWLIWSFVGELKHGKSDNLHTNFTVEFKKNSTLHSRSRHDVIEILIA